MRAACFEIGLPDWRAAKSDIWFIGQVEMTVNRWVSTGSLLDTGAHLVDIRRQSYFAQAQYTLCFERARSPAQTPPLRARSFT